MACTYHNLAKECPLTIASLAPYFWPNFLYRVKLYSNECPPRSELRVANEAYPWNLRSTVPSLVQIWGKKLCVILHWRSLQRIFAMTNIANAVCTVSYTMLMVTWCRSECCVPSGLYFEAVGGSVVHYFQYFLWGHKVAVNTTWVLFCGMRKHSKEHLPPLWQTCECSFTRLQYTFQLH